MEQIRIIAIQPGLCVLFLLDLQSWEWCFGDCCFGIRRVGRSFSTTGTRMITGGWKLRNDKHDPHIACMEFEAFHCWFSICLSLPFLFPFHHAQLLLLHTQLCFGRPDWGWAFAVILIPVLLHTTLEPAPQVYTNKET